MLSNFFNRFEELFIALLLIAMTLITFSQVVARYIFNTGAVWALELTSYLFAWLIFFGISYGVRVGAHIGVDALVRILPSQWQRTWAILVTLIGMVYAVLFFLGGAEYVYKISQTGWQSTDIPVPQWLPYSILPIGMALLLFRFAQVLFKILKGSEVRILADEVQDTIKEFDQTVTTKGIKLP
jgi:C4-dicarboxylate transporter DctQ subunit